ncbi:MAG: hypothetical protein K6G90_09865 [Clostridia bacterium]|nr:hypothetical protein [Clostridia bacterium]
MFDFHTHILPAIDDGSKSVEMSLQMIRELARQGVTGIASTSHFYADQNSPVEFLKRRQTSWEALRPALDASIPPIRLGAEVHYFDGIEKNPDIPRLRISGTKILLLEMPASKWPRRVVNSVVDLNHNGGITVMLAHIERYIDLNERDIWDYFLDNDIVMQVSCEFFTDKHTRRQAIRMLEAGRIHVLGTDSHNMQSRKPNFGPCMEFIRKKLGNDAIRRMEYIEDRLLNET